VGLAVYHAYLSRSGFADESAATKCLESAMDAVSTIPMGSSLHGGITGVAWAMAHLRGRVMDDDDDATAEIDQLLLKYLKQTPWRGDYDLIGGLVGIGVYALEQCPASRATKSLREAVDRLDENAERSAQGITWFTPPELLPEWQRQACPNGYYNLGVAHGVPGVIAFLAQVCARQATGNAAERLEKKARELLEGAVVWLLAQQNSAETLVSAFSSWTGPGVDRDPSRVGWCYGDLGIATVLMAAARSVGNAKWEAEAMRLAQHVAERPEEDSGVVDCGLCHGAAGIGHLFNRMYQATGHPKLRQAACHWFERALEMRRPGNGIAGFAARSQDGWHDEVGILEGAAGIALALLAAAGDVEPEWDRMLLVSMPQPSAAGGGSS
jgi:lantibiotic modifying enzyme